MEERMKAYYRKYKELVDAKADGDKEKTNDKTTVEDMRPAE